MAFGAGVNGFHFISNPAYLNTEISGNCKNYNKYFHVRIR